MKKKSKRLSGRIFIIDGSGEKLWYTLDEEHHAEFILSEEETGKFKEKILDHIKNINL